MTSPPRRPARERDPMASAPSIDQWVTLSEYQEFTLLTDKNPKAGYAGLRFTFLGLYGEVGSLMAALKKKQRDADSFAGYAESVLEEFGDVLWYFTNIAARTKLPLPLLAQRVFREVDDWDEVGETEFATFGDIQPHRERTGPVSDEQFEHGVIALAGKVGRLLDDVASDRVEKNRDVLSSHMVEIFRALIRAANDADISLEQAVRYNVSKVTSRWPIKPIYPPLFDEGWDPDEQIPRRIEMLIAEKTVGGKTFVVQRCNGINIGDRLTDNKAEQDDYRFHDVFHLAYAAILGWSPVTRSLFKVKRKSDPRVDENEDGARAALIEEGIATLVFNHAQRLNFYAETGLEYDLLTAIREFVKGYEVEACPLWLWEEAILEGFKAFRYLKQHRSGLVVADLSSRKLFVEGDEVTSQR